MNRRYAAKEFDPNRHISDEDWHTIIETGRLSPSSMGLEPWQFFDIQSAKLKEQIKPHAWGMQRQMAGADHVLLVASRKHMKADDPYLVDFIKNFKHYDYDAFATKFSSFLNNDLEATTPRALDDWALRQSYIAMGNMMSAAAFLDIDSCPIEGFNHKAVNQLMADAGVYNPEDYQAAYFIVFGYATTPVKPKLRRSLDKVYREVK